MVANNGDAIIGGLVAYVMKKYEQQRTEVYVYDLAVAHDAQRQGIGRALMEELRQEAKRIGAYIIFVQAEQQDEAVHFYRSLDPIEEIPVVNFDLKV